MAHYLRKKRNTGRFSLSTCKDLAFLFSIAQQKGFLHDQSLNIRLDMVPYARKSLDKLIEGQIDCAILVETNVAYLGYIKPKIPIKCLASFERRYSDNILIRHEGPQKLSPDDLKGKLIGFLPRSTSHSLLIRFLEYYNIDKSEIELKVITPQAMPDALMRGEVDAISCWHPHINNTIFAMNELGMNYTLFKNTGFYASEVVLATTKPFLIKNRALLQRFLKALKMAEEYMQQNKQETLDILANTLKLSGQNHDEIWQEYDCKLRPLEENYKGNVDIIAQWIKEKDTQFQGDPLPDYDDLIDNKLFLDTFRNDGL